MVKLLLARHTRSEAEGVRLAGRMPGIALSAEGADHAEQLARRLSPFSPTAVYSSPLDQAIATAAPLAIASGLAIEVDPGLIDIDCGEWTGRTYDELSALHSWQVFNETPARAIIPGGESLVMAGSRALQTITRIAHQHPGETIVAVSHGDVIRLLLARILGMPLDAFRRLSVEPGGCCELVIDDPHPMTVVIDALAPARLDEFPRAEAPVHGGRSQHVSPRG